jgi:hypothetical protein
MARNTHRVILTSLCFSLLTFAHAQENYGIENELFGEAREYYSVGLVKDFMTKVDLYNENHQSIEYFIEAFSEESDRRFLRQYVQSIGLTGLRPFSYANGRVFAVYPAARVEFGPIEVHEGKIILDGKHYNLSFNSSARSQLVAIKQILDEHLKSRASEGSLVNRVFSSLSRPLMSDAHAFVMQNIRGSVFGNEPHQNTGDRIDEVAAIVILTTNFMSFNRFPDESGLRENIKKFAEAIEQRVESCRSELEIMTYDNNRYTGVRTYNNESDYQQTFPLLRRLNVLSSPHNGHAIQEMSYVLKNFLDSSYPVRESPNFCRDTFSKGFSPHEEEDLRKLCMNLNNVRDCMIEFRAQTTIYRQNREDWAQRIRERDQNAGSGGGSGTGR